MVKKTIWELFEIVQFVVPSVSKLLKHLTFKQTLILYLYSVGN